MIMSAGGERFQYYLVMLFIFLHQDYRKRTSPHYNARTTDIFSLKERHLYLGPLGAVSAF
jgi:hypothetical protein